jgi:hypothetical protein
MNPKTVAWDIALCLLTALAFASAGCSGRPANVAAVNGKVTLGGQPLPDAVVMFTPVNPGSPSAGRTNSSGEYELSYTRTVKGAEKGEHNVSISTFMNATDDPPAPEVPEKVPYAYREGAKALKATVNAGSNEINFDLEPGPVDAPQPKGKGKGKGKGTLPCY